VPGRKELAKDALGITSVSKGASVLDLDGDIADTERRLVDLWCALPTTTALRDDRLNEGEWTEWRRSEEVESGGVVLSCKSCRSSSNFRRSSCMKMKSGYGLVKVG